MQVARSIWPKKKDSSSPAPMPSSPAALSADWKCNSPDPDPLLPHPPSSSEGLASPAEHEQSLAPATSAPPSRNFDSAVSQPVPLKAISPSKRPKSGAPPVSRPRSSFRGVVIPVFKREDDAPRLPPQGATQNSHSQHTPPRRNVAKSDANAHVAASAHRRILPPKHQSPTPSVNSTPQKRRRSLASESTIPVDATSEVDELDMLPPSPSKRSCRTHKKLHQDPRRRSESSAARRPPSRHFDLSDDEIDFLSPSRRLVQVASGERAAGDITPTQGFSPSKALATALHRVNL